MQYTSQVSIITGLYNMAEQIIDIRQRIEKMRIKFDDHHENDISNIPNKENHEENKEISNLPNKVNNHQKEEIKSNKKGWFK